MAIKKSGKKSNGKKISKKERSKKTAGNKSGVKNSLVNNINARKKRYFREEEKTTIGKKEYDKIEKGWKEKK